jgi:uncharacterized membrane protein
MSKYGTTVKRLNESESDGAGVENYRPCTVCKKSTLSATLSQYGARCQSCFVQYVNEAPQPYEGANKRTDGLKAWAWNLRARELAGGRLSPTQRAMWRTALRNERAVEELAA